MIGYKEHRQEYIVYLQAKAAYDEVANVIFVCLEEGFSVVG